MNVDNLAKNIIYKELENTRYVQFCQLAKMSGLFSDEYFIDYFLPKLGNELLIDVLMYTSLPIQKIFNKYIKILTNQKFYFDFLISHKYKFFDYKFTQITTFEQANKFLLKYIPSVVLVKTNNLTKNLAMKNFKEYIKLYTEYYNDELYG